MRASTNEERAGPPPHVTPRPRTAQVPQAGQSKAARLREPPELRSTQSREHSRGATSVTTPWPPPERPRTRASQTQCAIGLLCSAGGERRQDKPCDACCRARDNNLTIIPQTAGRSGLTPSAQPLPIAACEERRAQPAPRSAPGCTEARPDELGSAPAAGYQLVLEQSGRPRSLVPAADSTAP